MDNLFATTQAAGIAIKSPRVGDKELDGPGSGHAQRLRLVRGQCAGARLTGSLVPGWSPGVAPGQVIVHAAMRIVPGAPGARALRVFIACRMAVDNLRPGRPRGSRCHPCLEDRESAHGAGRTDGGTRCGSAAGPGRPPCADDSRSPIRPICALGSPAHADDAGWLASGLPRPHSGTYRSLRRRGRARRRDRPVHPSPARPRQAGRCL
jgi:hypothetical protein